MAKPLIIAFALLAIATTSPADDWPAWRRDGTGIASSVPTPTAWSESQNIRWKTQIPGTGHSSPIFFGNSIFLTTAIDGIGNESITRHRITVVAAAVLAGLIALMFGYLSTRLRKRSDNHDVPPIPTGSIRRRTHHRLAGFVTIASAICAAWAALHLSKPETQTLRHVFCINRQTGTIRWQTECAAGPLLGSTAITSAASATPVTDGRHVYAHFGDAGTYCLDYDGRILWANNDPAPETHYKAASSPILWNDLLIVTHDTDSRSFTVALDKHTGAKKWLAERKPANEGRRVRVDAYSTPIILHIGDVDQLVHDSHRQLTGYDPATGRMFWAVATDAEQIVTSPVAAGDIVVFSGECNHPIHMTAVRLALTEKGVTPVVLWQTNQHVPVVCSPVIFQNRVFAVSKNGIATCRDLETGELIWRLRLPGRIYASATIVNGHLYLTNLDGVTTIIATDDEPRIVATNHLNEPVFASPAVCDAELFIRGIQHLYCIADTTR